jgi:glycosyltransferase involved in cell wall biosynthesis
MGREIQGLLIYPISIDHPGNRGIINKMEYQLEALSSLAGHVDLVCSSRLGPVFNGKLAAHYPITGRWFNSVNHYGLFWSYLEKYVHAKPYDFLYIRYPLALPSFLSFLREARRANPRLKIICEIATFPYRREFTTPKRRALLFLDDLGRARLKHYLDGIVTFYGQSEIFGIPCFQLTNGVDAQRITLRKDRRTGDDFAMIAVGNIAERHGIDRVLHGMASYRNRPGAMRVSLDIVGDGPSVPFLTDLTTRLHLDDFVHFHGNKHGADLDALFDEADVALDSLAIHRLRLPCSSSLKAREYCARGIPFVVASDDPDFRAPFPFAHRISSTDAPLELPSLLQFHANLRATHPRAREEMRRYAEQHLTWKTKLAPLADYLRHD